MKKPQTLEIAIMRHGRPDTPDFGKIGANQFQRCLDIYNEASLSEASVPCESIIKRFSDYGVIVTSDLKRSRETALRLVNLRSVITDPVFREVQLPSISVPCLRLNPLIWAEIFYKLWLYRCIKAGECPDTVTSRAVSAATKLIQLAEQHQKILLTGHGIINGFIGKALIQHGWSGPAKPAKDFWGYVVYRKTKS